MAKIERGFLCEKERKSMLLDKKLQGLINRNHGTRTPQPTYTGEPEIIQDFVVNSSKHEFTPDQLNLLNRGLNFAIETTKPIKDEVIVDVESGIKHTPTETKEEIRRYTAEVLKGLRQKSHKAKKSTKILKELKEKPVFYLEADKGNSVVIMDKDDYDQKVMNKLATGNFKELRHDPLPETIKKVEKVLKECEVKLLSEDGMDC